METDAFRHHRPDREALVHIDSPELMGFRMEVRPNHNPLVRGRRREAPFHIVLT